MALYLGKINKSEQLEQGFYAAGPRGDPWYGGIEPGDFVFPISGGVDRLWKVKEYTRRPNNIHPEDPGVVTFETVLKFDAVSMQNFLRFKYFELDLNLLNRSVKPVKNCGFHPIATRPDCPIPQEISFGPGNLRNIFVALNGNDPPVKNDLDIILRVTPSADNKLQINSVKMVAEGAEQDYLPLWNLYLEKNPADERYSLERLLKNAQEDGREEKVSYLTEVLDGLHSNGFFRVEHPVQLYDRVIIGKRRVSHRPGGTTGADDEQPPQASLNPKFDRMASLLDQNPNLILYGPPGTGKTYGAKRIIEAYERRKYPDSEKTFEDLAKESRVEFLSFHQSYSYEEFVEGIRPVLTDPDKLEGTNSESVNYSMVQGRLQKIAESAQLGAMTVESRRPEYTEIHDAARFWKVSLGERADTATYRQCIEGNYVAVGWLADTDLTGFDYDHIFALLEQRRDANEPSPTNDASSLSAIVSEISSGDLVLIYDGPTTIRDIGVVTSDYYYQHDDNPYAHRRHVNWLKSFDPPVDILEMNGGKRLTMKTVYSLHRIGFADVRQLVRPPELPDTPSTLRPYYLVIDEINRGNIAKIFGELITLVEKDKREHDYVTLLYSGKRFTLPRNLYIIGTMNTADRSIAMLDAALRRRFTFVEMEPDASVFSESPQVDLIEDRINIKNLLNALNKKITASADRDHRIGHSYLMDLSSIEDLHYRWYYQIIPLIMDYFYGDFEKAKDIVGKTFFDNDGNLKIYDLATEKENFLTSLEATIGL